MALAASTSRQSQMRAEQAELLLAQTQRSHEEQLRAARLEESTRIAREIHDVLAHALAGLTIQLEATSVLIEQGADRDSILSRVHRAHDLAREGLEKTRRAVGALREDPVADSAGIKTSPTIALKGGRADRADGSTVTRTAWPARPDQVVLRVAEEALADVRKHARGAAVSVGAPRPAFRRGRGRARHRQPARRIRPPRRRTELPCRQRQRARSEGDARARRGPRRFA